MEKYNGTLDDIFDFQEKVSVSIADTLKIKLGQSTDKLLVSYYKKIKKVTDPITALKFYHVESYILNSIRQTISSELPFVNVK